MTSLIGTLLRLPAILFALSVHEAAHAGTAALLGDDYSTKQGRFTLNPLAHVDPWGFLCLLLFGFGWAKPVLIDPRAFKHPRRDDVLVSLAGPVSNIILAIFFAWLFKLMLIYAPGWFELKNYGEALFGMMLNFILINIGLAVFNLIPIPPLDGSHLIAALIPEGQESLKIYFYRYGSMALLLVILLQGFFEIDILPIGKGIQMLANWIFSLIGLGIRF